MNTKGTDGVGELRIIRRRRDDIRAPVSGRDSHRVQTGLVRAN